MVGELVETEYKSPVDKVVLLIQAEALLKQRNEARQWARYFYSILVEIDNSGEDSRTLCNKCGFPIQKHGKMIQRKARGCPYCNPDLHYQFKGRGISGDVKR